MIHASFSDHAIYRKALEIFTLSSRISSCMSEDLSSLNPYGQEDELIYFSGDIVQHSYHLGPEIIKAEALRHSEDKYKHIESLNKLTFRLIQSCKKLEHSKSRSKEFLPILKKEVSKFRRLQHQWMLTL